MLVKANEEIDEIKAKAIDNSGVEKVKIRSVLTCESKHGVCMYCYGRNLATGALGEARRSRRHHRRPIHRRTRHAADDAYVPHRWNGVAGVQAAADQGQVRRPVRYNELRLVQLEDGNNIVLNKNGSISILAKTDANWKRTTSSSAPSSPLPNGGKVKKGETFVQWDPYNVPILSEKAGQGEIPRHHRRCHDEAGSG